jgi:hypothetical protein
LAKLGYFYKHGSGGLRQDPVKARELYKRAAEKDHVPAFVSYAVMLNSGEGGPQDRGEAHRWYRKAAEAGDEIALESLADCYYSGLENCARNLPKAMKYIHFAKEKGTLFTKTAKETEEKWDGQTGLLLPVLITWAMDDQPRDNLELDELLQRAIEGYWAGMTTIGSDLIRDAAGMDPEMLYKDNAWYTINKSGLPMSVISELLLTLKETMQDQPEFWFFFAHGAILSGQPALALPAVERMEERMSGNVDDKLAMILAPLPALLKATALLQMGEQDKAYNLLFTASVRENLEPAHMKSGNEGNAQRMDCWYSKNRNGRFFPGKVVVGSIVLAVCIIFCFSGTYADNDGDAWDQLKTALENVSADQLKPLKDVLGDGISPSQLLDGMRAIDAILSGDWTKAGENSAELVIGLFSSTFGGYLNIHKAAREATKAVIENWVQDLYDHPAYKGVVDVLNRHIIDSAKAKNPYLPSYLCGSHLSLRNNMLERETGMYESWVSRPAYDVEDLVTGTWAARIRQATGRAGLTERQVFNALLVKAVEDQKSFILTTFQRVTMESAAGEVRANLGHKARTILAQIDAASQDEIGVGPIIATRDTFDGPLLGESAEVGDILAFQVERIGTWDEGHTVEWLMNGQTYKKEPASDSKVHLLRFDSEPLSPGNYRVVVLALADNQVVARQEAKFVLKDEFTVTELPAFAIRSFFDEPGGKPLGPYASKGDTVAFSADIEHPLFGGEPKASEVFWQLYDKDDQPVQGVFRRYMALENGTVKTYVFKFILDNLEPGIHKVGATHYLLEKPDVKSQASTYIEVFDAAIMEGIVVTDHPGGKTHETFLTNDRLPHIYVYYRLAEGIAGADASITVTDADTGVVFI